MSGERRDESGEMIFGRSADDGYGRCGRCGLSWRHNNLHTTFYAERAGVFVLCEECWERLTPEARLPYYRAIWEDWHRFPPTNKTHAELLVVADDLDRDWVLIEAAVLAGR